LKTAAQKPTIDLLPSASESVHPEAMIDTCVTPDSLFLLDSITVKHSPALKKRTIKTVALVKPGLYPRFIKNINPISFIIHFTALKF